MTRVQLTDEQGEFTGPYSPIGEYGPSPERPRQQFEFTPAATPASSARTP
ncbi:MULTISPECIES: hypothetical protein [unclassified Streptomyces]